MAQNKFILCSIVVTPKKNIRLFCLTKYSAAYSATYSASEMCLCLNIMSFVELLRNIHYMAFVYIK